MLASLPKKDHVLTWRENLVFESRMFYTVFNVQELP